MKYYAPRMEYGNERRKRLFRKACEVIAAVAFWAMMAAMCYIGCIVFN